MLNEREIEDIIDTVSQEAPFAEFLDHGDDGVVFQFGEAVLKVFADRNRACSEIVGFREIAKLNKGMVPEVYAYGSLGPFFAILREDIWDVGGYANDVDARDFMRTMDETVQSVAKRVAAGESLDDLAQEVSADFRARNSMEDDNEIFNKDLFALAVRMHMNETPIPDISLDNIGVSAQDGEVKVRDMSRFATTEVLDFTPYALRDFKKESSLDTAYGNSCILKTLSGPQPSHSDRMSSPAPF